MIRKIIHFITYSEYLTLACCVALVIWVLSKFI